MARNQTRVQPRNIDEGWTCTLSAAPARVSAGNQLTLTVTLTQPQFGQLSQANIESVYAHCFTYTYDTTDPQLQQALNAARQNLNVALVSLPPSLQANPYAINVKVSPQPNMHELLLGIADGVTSAEERRILERLPSPAEELTDSVEITVLSDVIKPPLNVNVYLQRTFVGHTKDQGLWPAIRNRTAAIGFDRYKKFIDCVFCHGKGRTAFNAIEHLTTTYLSDCLDNDETNKYKLSINGPYAYNVLKIATQAFLTLESGVIIRDDPDIVDIDKEQILRNNVDLDIDQLKTELKDYLVDSDRLPYFDRIVENLITLDGRHPREVLPYCRGVLDHRLTSPSLIELIWSYWHEEGMLVQTMNAIAFRFQNRRASPNDPLGELEFDPLRPLNNLIWGFIQDEHNRLTVPRRAYEYHHHYGLSLLGKAVPDLTPADTRSKFIEGFHNLLAGVARFYQQDSDTTVIADAFPLLNALKEVHLLLAEGAHNQFGDLTWSSRVEMLMMQWMLARPEMKEFLRGRYMVPYQEDWMGAVDSMKKLQGWTDTTITHFHELAVTGERILLSIRYGDWSDLENIEEQAKNWARSWKPEIQRYLHGYRTVTGVDLMAEVTDSRDAATRFLQPSALLQRRLAEQTSGMSSVAAPQRAGLLASRVSGRAELPMPNRAKLPIYRRET